MELKISGARERDRASLVLMYENVQILLRTYAKTKDPWFFEEAKKIGGYAKQVKNRIQTFDYSEWDARDRRIARQLPSLKES